MLASHVDRARRALSRWEVVSSRVRRIGGAANYFPMSELWALNKHCEVLASNQSQARKPTGGSVGSEEVGEVANVRYDKKEEGSSFQPSGPFAPGETLMRQAETGAAAALSCLYPRALLPSGRPAVTLFTNALSEQWSRTMSNSTEEKSHDDDDDDEVHEDVIDGNRSAERRLTAVCNALDHAVKVVCHSGEQVPRLRFLTFPDTEDHGQLDLALDSLDGSGLNSNQDNIHDSSNSITSGGLQLVVVESIRAALAEALSAFGNSSTLPEWHNFLHVHRQMPFDLVTTFVRRAATPEVMPPGGASISQYTSGASSESNSIGSKEISSNSSSTTGSNLHVLVTPETLPLDAQYRLLDLLRSLTDQQSAAVNLLIVCVQAHTRGGAPMANNDARSPLLTQLGSYRRGSGVWSDTRLRSLWERGLSKEPHSGGMELLTSLSPGAGKSFEARRGASLRGERYVYVRVNRPVVSPCELSALLQQRLHDAEEEEDDEQDEDDEDEADEGEEGQNFHSSSFRRGSKVCVHLDLAETVLGSSLDRTLFALLVLGCLPNYDDSDTSSGATAVSENSNNDSTSKHNEKSTKKALVSRLWWWNPATTSFAIEIKSSLANFPSLSWMPRRMVAPSPKTFCADHASLLAGWGQFAFHNARYDGTLDVLAGIGNRADAPLPREVIALNKINPILLLYPSME